MRTGPSTVTARMNTSYSGAYWKRPYTPWSLMGGGVAPASGVSVVHAQSPLLRWKSARVVPRAPAGEAIAPGVVDQARPEHVV